jgi:hypothetical protein
MPKLRLAIGAVLFTTCASAGLLLAPAISSGGPAAVAQTTFPLFPNPATVNCLRASSSVTPTATATVKRGPLNDQLTLTLKNFKVGLGFDLFTVQRSNQNANGTPVAGFTSFGLAWYQSDIHITGATSTVTIKTILLDQIFGFDPDVSLAPTNTFHVGFWFDKPADAAPCVGTVVTPFNGTHDAGPLAFITRPRANGLGPLCTSPNLSTHPPTCNP